MAVRSYFKVVLNVAVILSFLHTFGSTTLLKHIYHSMEMCVCFRHLHFFSVHAINAQLSTAQLMPSVWEPLKNYRKVKLLHYSITGHEYYETTHQLLIQQLYCCISCWYKMYQWDEWSTSAILWQAVNSGAREGEMWATNTFQGLHSFVLVVI